MARFRQRSRIANLSVTSIAALAVATAAAPAFAQDEAAAAPDAPAGDEIVVTAQFREQNLQDTIPRCSRRAARPTSPRWPTTPPR